jgi:hypothetical protein
LVSFVNFSLKPHGFVLSIFLSLAPCYIWCWIDVRLTTETKGFPPLMSLVFGYLNCSCNNWAIQFLNFLVCRKFLFARWLNTCLIFKFNSFSWQILLHFHYPVQNNIPETNPETYPELTTKKMHMSTQVKTLLLLYQSCTQTYHR